MSAKNRSVLMMVVCATLWSIAGIFIKMVPWNPLVIAGVRSGIATVVVFLFMKVAKYRFRFNKQSLLSGFFLGTTFMAFVTANKLTTAANAIVLQFTAPVFIILISVFVFKQAVRRSDLIVVLITMLGIALCFLDQLTAGSVAGVVVGISSGFFMGAMFAFTGRSDEDTPMTSVFLGQLYCALVGIPVAFFTPTPVDTKIVFSLLALGVLQLGIPYILYALAAKHCSALACCLIGAIEPLLNPIWVFLFDGEVPGVLALVGGVIVIANITIWSIWNDRQAAALKTPEHAESGV